jgi:hypothetical protein
VLVRALFRLVFPGATLVIVIVIVVGMTVSVPVTRAVGVFVFVFVLVFVLGGNMHVGMRRPIGVRMFGLKVHSEHLAHAGAESCRG